MLPHVTACIFVVGVVKEKKETQRATRANALEECLCLPRQGYSAAKEGSIIRGNILIVVFHAFFLKFQFN
jgi:hypothetical protein